MKTQRGDGMYGLALAQLGWQNCHLYASAALHPKGNSLVLISVRTSVDVGQLHAERRNTTLENLQGSNQQT